jgi:flagellar assembly factor FliW
MKVSTKAWGDLEIDERQKVVFPDGLFGFEPQKEYVLLDAEQEPYYYLQSLDSEAAAFILLKPFLFRSDYEIDVEDAELSDIGLDDPSNALVFCIVTVPSDGSPVTANLQGPLIINRDNRIGRQVVLQDPRWHTKHDIARELENSGASGGAAC